MANAYVRMRHPDYDVLRGMLDDVGRTMHVHADVTPTRSRCSARSARPRAARSSADLDPEAVVRHRDRGLAGARARRRRAARAARRPRR